MFVGGKISGVDTASSLGQELLQYPERSTRVRREAVKEEEGSDETARR